MVWCWWYYRKEQIKGRCSKCWSITWFAEINFFSTVAISDEHQPATHYTPPSCTKPPDSSFHFTSISAKVTQTMLQHLNIRKSTGPDGLSGCFLKEVAVEIAEPLTKLYNISLQSGCIPLEWKHCNVTAVHKSGSQQIFVQSQLFQ